MEAFKREEDFEMPENPSAGIRVAVHDLELCEQHPDYKIGMSVWHETRNFPSKERHGRKLCVVCLGGSILARKIDNPSFDLIHPENTLDRKIVAMDSFRRGCITNGVSLYYATNISCDWRDALREKVEAITPCSSKDWVSYSDSEEVFKKNLLEVADKLEAIGL